MKLKTVIYYPLWQLLPTLLLLSTVTIADDGPRPLQKDAEVMLGSPSSSLVDLAPGGTASSSSSSSSSSYARPRLRRKRQLLDGFRFSDIFRIFNSGALEGVDTMLRSTRNLDVFQCIERFSCEMAAPLRNEEGQRPFNFNNMDNFAQAVNDEFIPPADEEAHDEHEAAADEGEEAADDEKPASDAPAQPTLPAGFSPFYFPGYPQQFVQPAVQQFIQPAQQPFMFPSPFFYPSLPGQIPYPFVNPLLFREPQTDAKKTENPSDEKKPSSEDAPEESHAEAAPTTHSANPPPPPVLNRPNFPPRPPRFTHSTRFGRPFNAPPQFFAGRPGRSHRNIPPPPPPPVRRRTGEDVPLGQRNWFSGYRNRIQHRHDRSNWRRRVLGFRRKRSVPQEQSSGFRRKPSVSTEPLSKMEMRSRIRRGIMDTLKRGFERFEGKGLVRALDRMMQGTDNSLYPYTRAALMGYTGTHDTCESLYPNCPTTSDELIDTFNNLRSYFPNGVPFRDRIPAPIRFLLP